MYKFNDIAKSILESDYLLPDENPEIMFDRVAKIISEAESTPSLKQEWYIKFLDTMKKGLWIPSTPFLMNSGVNNMFSSCFVLGGLEDDLHSIFVTNERAANITKMGGGLGINISKLREKNTLISSTKGQSSGAVSFMKIFDATLTVVKQARRRGAGIIVMDIYHPDIEEFINVKGNHSLINNFNISVLVDDDFMNAVINNADIQLKSPLGHVTKSINAKKLFNNICENAKKNAEPGIVFKTTINNDNPCLRNLGEIVSVNACGEIPLYDNEACNLSAIILSNMVTSGEINKELLSNTVKTVVRFLDNSIELNNYPDNHIREAVLKTRKLGIGVMGLNDMLVKMGHSYNSEKGRDLAEKVLSLITDEAKEYSCQLISEGRELPSAWYGSKYESDNIPIRNLSVTAGQPTGATQVLCDSICASSGIEPFFAIAYTRKAREKDYVVINSLFEDIGKQEGWFNDIIVQKILNNNGSCQQIKEIPLKWRKLFLTATEISWQDHIKMQAVCQQSVTNSLSKTINMPIHTTVEDVYNVYIMAWQSKCKGCTVYVQNSRDNQVLSTNKKDEPPIELDNILPKRRKTLGRLEGATIDKMSGCSKIYITINRLENHLVETFISTGKGGGCKANTDAISKLISLCLRGGIKVPEIVRQLKGIKCHNCTRRKDCEVEGLSCPDIVGKFIEDEYNRLNYEIDTKSIYKGNNQCPECENQLVHTDGCISCSKCTYSKCE